MTERRALLIDDNDDHRNWLAAALCERSWEVIATRSGKIALDVAVSQHPHVIISELVLPDVHGLQLARAFRMALEHDVTIIAVTRVPDLEPQAIAATYDHVLGKPVDLVQLFARVIAPSSRSLFIDPVIAASARRGNVH
jgi:DNA-binding response OmpR family regulator